MAAKAMKPEMRSEAAVQRVLSVAMPIVVAIFAFIGFIPALTAGYSDFDDVGTLILTQNYREITGESLQWMFTTGRMGHYQPLAWLSFAIEYAIVGGLNPVVSHAVNMVFHAASAALVCLLARRLIAFAKPTLPWTLREAAAALAAMLFAVHPLRVESVAWVTERRDVLSLFFYLLAILAYLTAYPPGSERPVSTSKGVMVLVWFLLSLLAKAWAMTFFMVLLTLDWYPLRRLSWPGRSWFAPGSRAVLIQKAPFALIGIAWVFIAGVAQSSNKGVTRSLAEWGIIDRICQACYGIFFYVSKTVWPVNLAALYELPKSMSPSEPRVIAGFVCLVILGAVILFGRRHFPALAAALLTYIFIVSPVLGLFQSGIQLVADRYSYISTIGLAIVAGAAIVIGAQRASKALRPLIALASLALIAILFALSWKQAKYWQSSEDLFAHAIEVGQDGPILRANYGRELAGVPRRDDALAIEQFKRAIALKPDYGQAWFELARSLHNLNRVAEAEEAYKAAQRYMPDSWNADVSLGLLYAEKKDDLEAAIVLFRSAVQKIEGPENWAFAPDPYMPLAQALYDTGDIAGARRELLKAYKHKKTHDQAASALRMIDGARR